MTSKSSISDESVEHFSSVTRRSVVLNPDDLEIWEMYYYAGLLIDPKVFRAILDLLRLDIHPKVVMDMLERVMPASKYSVHARSGRTGSSSVQVPNQSALRKSSKSSRSDSTKAESLRPARKSHRTATSSTGTSKSSES